MKEQQSWVAADDGLQRRPISGAEWILRSCQVAPPLNGGCSAGGQTIECISVVLTVFIDLVYLPEVAVAGILKGGGDEQEGIACVADHLFGNVLPIVYPRDGEIMDGRLVSLADLHRLAVDERPGGVGIVLKGERAPLAVFLKDELCLKLRLGSRIGQFHACTDVGSLMVGTEVEQRSVVETPQTDGDYEQQCVVDDDPLVGA